jgi:Fe-S-cluster containining protein
LTDAVLTVMIDGIHVTLHLHPGPQEGPTMATGPEPGPETITANAVLSLGGVRVRAAMTVPKRSVPLSDLLPMLRVLAGTIVDHAVETETAEGKTVSCRKGCGACCRQVVPLSEIEARQLRDLVDALPEPRRSEIRARFAAARKRLEESGLIEKLTHPERFTDQELRHRDLGLDYFRLGIPCPFLEEESCSIHPERPIACREYLVTSDPVHCANPSLETVHVVPLPGKVSTAVTLMGVDTSRRFTRWVPLILALEWAETHPDDLPPRTGPDWLRELFLRLTGQEIPAPKT